MATLNLEEAQLFRILANFFGRDQVVLHMSVLAVCGGMLPHPLPVSLVEYAVRYGELDLRIWAKQNTCLFTIVDQHDTPKMVIEFFSGFEQGIDIRDEEHQRILPALLSSLSIAYVTISTTELREILDPAAGVDFCTLLEHKFAEARELLMT